ncbi:MAG: 4-hydroxy-tetrahydrodipicolinate reductase [Proteobacteria bacterium]|nr:MAG: 4-hydroxy-tetrahydrodipicolinate reductase [Pseudomonadota bacterium]
MTIDLSIIGASGKNGQEIRRLLPEFADYRVVAAIVAPDCKTNGEQYLPPGKNHGLEVHYSSAISEAVSRAQLTLDFSSPASSVEACRCCAERGCPIVIATTGHSQEQLKSIQEYSAQTAVLKSANFSIGLFAALEASVAAQRVLGGSFEIEISEIHHRHKKDAPSGTALLLAEKLRESADAKTVYGRKGLRAPGEIGLSSQRGGDVAGEHTVYFLGSGERVEVTHRVQDRSVFARGALTAGLRMIGRSPGLYALPAIVSPSNGAESCTFG